MAKPFTALIEGIAEPLPGTRLLYLESAPLAAATQPGQFLLVRCGEGHDPYLREAVPVHRFSANGVAILLRPTRPGLAWIASRRVGDHVDVLGPCGRGFVLPGRLSHLSIVYQGMGIAPLLGLVDRADCDIRLVSHAPTASQVYPRALLPRNVEYVPHVGREQQAAFWHAVEDSCRGGERICAAGPDHLLVELQELVRRCCVTPGKDLAQAWVDRDMTCGLGICQGCSVATQHGPRRVCADGPVFDLMTLILH
ncbi:MAG: iron-sulfur cluster-binding protein [Anaerolineae bacterium]